MPIERASTSRWPIKLSPPHIALRTTTSRLSKCTAAAKKEEYKKQLAARNVWIYYHDSLADSRFEGVCVILSDWQPDRPFRHFRALKSAVPGFRATQSFPSLDFGAHNYEMFGQVGRCRGEHAGKKKLSARDDASILLEPKSDQLGGSPSLL